MEATLLLFTLIKKLNSHERNHVEVFLESETSNLTSTLYYLIKDLNEPSKEILETRWQLLNKKQKLTLKSLENTKGRLKSKLLQYLQECNINLIGGDAEQNLYVSEIYIQKQLYQEAYKTLQTFITKPQPLTPPVFKIQIIQKLIWLLPICKVDQIEQKQQHLLGILENTHKELTIFHELFQFNLQISALYSKSGILKTQEAITQLLHLLTNPLHKNDITLLPHLHATYLTKSNAMLAQLSGDEEKQFSLQKLLCTIMREQVNSYLESGAYINYMAEQINLAILSAQHGDEVTMFQILNHIRTTTTNTERAVNIIFNIQADLAETLFHFYRNNLHENRTILEKCDAELKKNISKFPSTLSESMRYGLMKCWLELGEYAKVDEWYLDRPENKPFVKLDSYFIIILIQLCAIYEQIRINTDKNTVKIPDSFLKHAHYFSSLYRLSKNMLPLEYHVHSTFESLGRERTVLKHIKLLNNLSKKLNVLAETEVVYYKQFNRMFNLCSWLEKMSNKLQKNTAVIC